MSRETTRNREYREQRVGRYHTYRCRRCGKRFRVFLTPRVRLTFPICDDCHWIKVEIPYIGSVLSVNHYKQSDGRHTRPEVTRWMSALESMTRLAVREQEVIQPVQIQLSAIFRDKRVPDLANLHKVIGDALEAALGINDKHFLFQDKGYTIDRNTNAMLYIRIKVTDSV